MTVPGYRGYHHARCQLPVVLRPDDLAAVMAERHVGRFGVERAGVGRGHRNNAQVADVPEGSIQVVHRCAERVQVSESIEQGRETNRCELGFLNDDQSDEYNCYFVL